MSCVLLLLTPFYVKSSTQTQGFPFPFPFFFFFLSFWQTNLPFSTQGDDPWVSLTNSVKQIAANTSDEARDGESKITAALSLGLCYINGKLKSKTGLVSALKFSFLPSLPSSLSSLSSLFFSPFFIFPILTCCFCFVFFSEEETGKRPKKKSKAKEARILVVNASPDKVTLPLFSFPVFLFLKPTLPFSSRFYFFFFSSQSVKYISFMNCVFSAQKLNVSIDCCNLSSMAFLSPTLDPSPFGPSHTPFFFWPSSFGLLLFLLLGTDQDSFFQQSANITNGTYYLVPPKYQAALIQGLHRQQTK